MIFFPAGISYMIFSMVALHSRSWSSPWWASPAWSSPSWASPAFSSNPSENRSANEHKNRPWNGSGRLSGAPIIDPKLLENRSLGGPGAPGASLEHREPLGGAPEVAPKHPGSVPGHSETAPGSQEACLAMPGETPRRSKSTKVDAKSPPGAETSSFFGLTRLRNAVEAIFRRILTIFQCIAKFANLVSYRAWRQKRRCVPSRSESTHGVGKP